MKGVVQTNPSEQSYTSIGGVVLPCDLDSGQITGDPVLVDSSHAADEKYQQTADRLATGFVGRPGPMQPVAARAPAPAPARVPTKRAATSPGSIIRDAKARIKEIRAVLRDHKRLEKELDELERLVRAARPLAPVREIRRSS